MKELVYLTRTGARNLGDVVLQDCVRTRLQQEGIPVKTVGFKEDAWQTYSDRDIVVSAGGFCSQHHQRPGEFRIYDWLLHRGNRLYFWGPGYNEYAVNVYDPDYLTPFDTPYDSLFLHENAVLCGFRDYANPHDYVPCPSCYAPLFDEQFDTRHEVVILEHESLKLCPPGGDDLPKKSHSTGLFTFPEVVRFIGEAETVLTNTYHGAYWSMLLNKKVVIYKPWSSKFHTFKYPPLFCNEQDWMGQLDLAENITPDFLDESREINEQFFRKIKKGLGVTA